MIGVVATFKARAGSAGQLAEIMAEVEAAVRANEPGNTLYQVMRSREDPDAFVVLELYETDDAFKAHQEGTHVAGFLARMGPLLAGRPQLQMLDATN